MNVLEGPGNYRRGEVVYSLFHAGSEVRFVWLGATGSSDEEKELGVLSSFSYIVVRCRS